MKWGKTHVATVSVTEILGSVVVVSRGLSVHAYTILMESYFMQQHNHINLAYNLAGHVTCLEASLPPPTPLKRNLYVEIITAL